MSKSIRRGVCFHIIVPQYTRWSSPAHDRQPLKLHTILEHVGGRHMNVLEYSPPYKISSRLLTVNYWHHTGFVYVKRETAKQSTYLGLH